MKLHLKSFTFGMGVGLVILSLTFLGAINIFGINETSYHSEEEIIKMAEGIGMVFPTQDQYVRDNPLNTQKNTNTHNETIETTESIVILEDEPLEDYVTINISYGTPAIDIAQMLYEENIIDDAEGFKNYLIAAGFTNRLRAGFLTFKTYSTFEEAASVLIGREMFPHEIP